MALAVLQIAQYHALDVAYMLWDGPGVTWEGVSVPCCPRWSVGMEAPGLSSGRSAAAPGKPHRRADGSASQGAAV